MFRQNKKSVLFVLLIALALSSCSDSVDDASKNNNPKPTSYTVTGKVTSLIGSGLVLQNNGGDNQVVTSVVPSFAFAEQNDSSDFAVTVLQQPTNPIQTCTVSSANDSGKVSGANVAVNMNCNTIPKFTSERTASASENATTTSYVANSTDLDGDAVTYGIQTGVSELDGNQFKIDTITGALSFKNTYIPNFENPTDTDGKNTYQLIITADDGINPKQAVTVTVIVVNVNDVPPVFINSPTANIKAQNGIVNTRYNATAVDSVEGDPITYSLTGASDDSNKFNIGISSGLLEFKTPPNFAIPTDVAPTDNIYQVEITASDGIFTVVQLVSVEVVISQLVLSVSNGGIKTLTFDWATYGGATHYVLLQQPSIGAGFNQTGENIATNSVDIEVPVHMTDWINSTFMLEAYDGANLLSSSDPINILSQLPSSIGYLKSPGASFADGFGFSVSVSADGSTLAVGARLEGGPTTTVINGSQQSDCYNSDGSKNASPVMCLAYSGAVYIFQRNKISTTSTQWGTWYFSAYIKAPNAGGNDRFGTSVSLDADGSTLAVGAYFEDSNGYNANQIAESVSPSPNDNDNTGNAGAVYIYQRDLSIPENNDWGNSEFTAYIKPPNSTVLNGGGSLFGCSVSLSANGGTLAVGAWAENSDGIDANGLSKPLRTVTINNSNTRRSGAAYIYHLDPSNTANRDWGLGGFTVYIKSTDVKLDARFGVSVSLSAGGDTLAVGAHLGATSGVYLYQIDPNTTGNLDWAQGDFTSYIPSPNSGMFGYSISLSGDSSTLAVGAYYESTGGETGGGIKPAAVNIGVFSAGAVYIYQRDPLGSGNLHWGQNVFTARIRAPNVQDYDNFGYSVSLNADASILAVGAVADDSDGLNLGGNILPVNTIENENINTNAPGSGAVYLYQRDPGDSGNINWGQGSFTSYIKAPNTGSNDVFGSSVSLSGDGSTLAIGAEQEASGGANSGLDGNQQDDCANLGSGTPTTNCADNSGAEYLY